MTELLEGVRWVSNATYVVLALAAIRLWVRHRTAAAAWVAGAFAATGMVVVIANFLPEVDAPTVWVKVLIIGLLALPWCLHRFAVTMDGIGRVWGLVFDGLVAGLAVFTLVIPRFPGPDEPVTTMMSIFTFWFLAVFVVLVGRMSWRLFRASRNQPGVIRSRLRVLAAAGVGLALAVAVPSGQEENLRALVGALLGVGSGLLFLVGFVPPRMLRTHWRAEEDTELQDAIGRLMLTTTHDEVARTVLPSMVGMVGADAGAIHDPSGKVRVSIGDDDGDLELADPQVVRLDLARGDVLFLRTSPYAPLFGEDERRLLLRLVTMVDLALDRSALLGSEREARRDAERANREVEAFVATITHDLRNPLTAIVGMSDLLEGPLASELSERALTFVSRISANADYMTGMVRDILDLAEISSAGTTAEPVDLALVASVVREEVALRAASVEVVVGALPEILADSTHVRRLFENAVGNAVKHAGRSDVRITITAKQTPDHLEISFQDNGKGIPTEAAERVFNLFEQLEGSEGSGLGLAICRKLVERLGGTLWFEPSDVGADLRVRFPASIIVSRKASVAPEPSEATR